MSTPNIHPETGIRYGVICPSFVDQWYEWSHAVVDEQCPHCGSGKVEIIDDVNGGYRCEDCKATFMEDESEDITVVGRTYTTIRYKANQAVEGEEIIISESPYFTYARLCAPTFPNAGDLNSAIAIVISESDGYKTYCFGHTWYNNGAAPYPIYKVSDGTLKWPGVKKVKKNVETSSIIQFKRSIVIDF